jgi:hypothetical protein
MARVAHDGNRSLNSPRGLWHYCNNAFIPGSGTPISIYVRCIVFLNSPNRGWVGFYKQSIFEPGEPQCVNACGFLPIGSDRPSPKETASASLGDEPRPLAGRCLCGLSAPLVSLDSALWVQCRATNAKSRSRKFGFRNNELTWSSV